MQELKKVLSGHLGRLVFLAGKVPVKGWARVPRGCLQTEDRRHKTRRPNIIRDTKRIGSSCCSLPWVKLQNEDPILFVSLSIW